MGTHRQTGECPTKMLPQNVEIRDRCRMGSLVMR